MQYIQENVRQLVLDHMSGHLGLGEVELVTRSTGENWVTIADSCAWATRSWRKCPQCVAYRGPWTAHRGPWAAHHGPWAAHRGPWAAHRGPWAAHSGLPTMGRGLPTVGHELTTVDRWLPTMGCLPRAVDCPPWADHCGPWAAHRGPWAAHRGQVEDKMSGFSLHKGVRLLGKSDLVFSLNCCWANCTDAMLMPFGI